MIEQFFVNQTPTGKTISILIFCLFGVYLVVEALNDFWLRTLNREIAINQAKIDEAHHFGNAYLKAVYQRFCSAKRINANAVDLQSILEKEMPRSQALLSGVARLLPGLMISLGLLGTFIGLSGSINRLIAEIADQSFAGSSAEDLARFAEFIKVIKSPLSSMGTAFGTSIFGLLFSILASIIRQAWVRPRQERSVGQIVDFFENEVGVTFESGLDRAISRLGDKLQASIDRFSGNISQLSSHLEISVHSIQTSVQGLNLAIDHLHDPIDRFRVSIDTFNESCRTLDQQVHTVNTITARLSQELGQTMQQGINDFVTRMDDASQKLSQAMIDGVSQLESLLVAVNRNLTSSQSSHEAMRESTASLREIYQAYLKNAEAVHDRIENLGPLLLSLSQEVRDLSHQTALSMERAFSQATLSIAQANALALSDTLREQTTDLRSGLNETRDITAAMSQNLTTMLTELNGKMGQFVVNLHRNEVQLHEDHVRNLGDVANVIKMSYQDFLTHIQELITLSENLQRVVQYMSQGQMNGKS